MFDIATGSMLLIALSALPIAALSGWVWHQVLRAGSDEEEVAPDERLLSAIVGHRMAAQPPQGP
ncbi:hypothetical protein [Roseateles violae]|uniref:Uncharacterized protein n=1 Tax=Roseateles violae TaxID=3058042 RepID=A0ABT8DQ66_9BURK|nr:hypothetical protein [Pelomonas sp. PFR6]MDN3920487.1 hypothetical protein [Pelomonas sp. PFR6]